MIVQTPFNALDYCTLMLLTLFMGWLLVPMLKDLATVTRPVESLIQWKTSSSPYEPKDRKSQNISTFIVVIHSKISQCTPPQLFQLEIWMRKLKCTILTSFEKAMATHFCPPPSTFRSMEKSTYSGLYSHETTYWQSVPSQLTKQPRVSPQLASIIRAPATGG